MKILDYLFPQNIRCLFCKKEDYLYGLCRDCYNKLPFITDKTCKICGGRLLKNEEVCKQCKDFSHKFIHNYSILDYNEMVAGKIIEFKQNKKKRIGEVFSHIVLEYYEKLEIKVDIIIPVPIHENRMKSRKFNQSEILASKIANKYGNVDTKVLVRIKDTPHQTGLSRENRQANLLDAFKVIDKKNVKDKSILLLDDIYTTGSTLDECARVLYLNGASEVYGLSFARGIVYNNIKK